MILSRRHARRIGRFVLLWFVLSLGAAVAAPLVQPRAMGVVCSAAGAVTVVVQTDDGTREPGASHLDCPLCLPFGAAPPVLAAMPKLTHLLLPGHGLRPIVAVSSMAVVAAPLPPRGPPAVS